MTELGFLIWDEHWNRAFVRREDGYCSVPRFKDGAHIVCMLRGDYEGREKRVYQLHQAIYAHVGEVRDYVASLKQRAVVPSGQ